MGAERSLEERWGICFCPNYVDMEEEVLERQNEVQEYSFLVLEWKPVLSATNLAIHLL